MSSTFTFFRCFHPNVEFWNPLRASLPHCVLHRLLQLCWRLHHQTHERNHKKGRLWKLLPSLKKSISSKNLWRQIYSLHCVQVLDTLRTLVIWLLTIVFHYTIKYKYSSPNRSYTWGIVLQFNRIAISVRTTGQCHVWGTSLFFRCKWKRIRIEK